MFEPISDQINSLIFSYSKERDWRLIAAFIRRCDGDSSWMCEELPSITSLVRILSRFFGKNTTTLWQYRRVAIFAEEFFLPRNHDIINDRSEYPKISPESLDLIRKIRQAAPHSEVCQLCKMLVNNMIQLKKLRKIWNSYKPALQGRTARGRGVEEPFLSNTEQERAQHLNSEYLYNLLKNNLQPKDLGSNPEDWLTVIDGIKDGAGKIAVECHATCIVGSQDGFELHCFVFLISSLELALEQSERLWDYCDRVWILSEESVLNEEDVSILSGSNIGVLSWNNKAIILSHAAQSNISPVHGFAFAKAVLAKK